MKTRYLNVVLLAAASAGFGLAACDTGSTALDPNVEARLRNKLPPTCTVDQFTACSAVLVPVCGLEEELVRDYSADCCEHYTCQPACNSPAGGTCKMDPAPYCPTRSKLWIGTAIEDCCPAYRCEPDGTTCDPTVENCGICNATNVACILALPYCGEDVKPIFVGQTADCCPIYQCPCGTVTDPATGVTTDLRTCGCTTPTCQDGEQLACDKKDACGGPCRCEPARGVCKDNSTCAADETCERTVCRLPPIAAAANAPTCDVAQCGPALGLPSRICPDGSTAGPTNRCLLNADGTCGWEVRDCPPDPNDCFGICVPNIQRGCRDNSECSTGYCEIACTGWGCSAGGTPVTNDPTAPTPQPGTVCGCDANVDRSCVCDASGNCTTQICEGKCAPKPTTCDPRAAICPAIAIACPDGATPVKDDTVDPNTCCPTYHCPMCRPTSTTSSAGTSNTACPAPRDCKCGAKVVATDPATCCPTYECAPMRADGTCG